MEMCYDGALVMPSSYAVMDEEEMTYVEGGACTVAQAARMIDIGVSVVLFAIGVGFGVGSIVWFMKNSVKGLVVAGLKRAIASTLVPLGFTAGSGIYAILTTIDPSSTIGNALARYIDSIDSDPNNGLVMG